MFYGTVLASFKVMKKTLPADSPEQESIHQRVCGVVDSMPPFPQSVMRLMEMTKDVNCSPKDLVSIIEHDPVMTMKILKLVNSAFFGLSRDVVSIQHALVFLGMNTVKNLAVSIASIDSLPQKSIPELPMESFLTHSLGTAFIAQRLAKDCIQLKDVSEYFIAGLLHGFGKMLFVQLEPQRYGKVLQHVKENRSSLPQLELEEIGMNYGEVGAMLAESWQLPSSLVDCIRMHLFCDAKSSDMSITIAAASMVATAMELGESGETGVDEFPDYVHQRLGVKLEAVIEQFHDLSDEVQQIQSMVGG